jgi:DNA-binding CsgD family transcriptional regulator
MNPREQALEVIGEIYDAALQPERWPHALRKVQEFVGTSQPLLLVPPAEPKDAVPVIDLPDAQRERMQVLVPHLVRAAEVMARLRDAKANTDAGLAALEELGCGVLVVDARGTITFRNPAARRILAEEDGLRFRERLVVGDSQAQKLFDGALLQCLRAEAQEHPRGIRVPRSSNRPDYILQVASLARGSAVVFISDPDSELHIDESLLKREYGFTPAESRLARLILNGETPASAAKHLGVSETTAKTQLQHVFQKTRTHRQLELVRLLLSLSPMRG